MFQQMRTVLFSYFGPLSGPGWGHPTIYVGLLAEAGANLRHLLCGHTLITQGRQNRVIVQAGLDQLHHGCVHPSTRGWTLLRRLGCRLLLWLLCGLTSPRILLSWLGLAWWCHRRNRSALLLANNLPSVRVNLALLGLHIRHRRHRLLLLRELLRLGCLLGRLWLLGLGLWLLVTIQHLRHPRRRRLILILDHLRRRPLLGWFLTIESGRKMTTHNRFRLPGTLDRLTESFQVNTPGLDV